jgi:hypothetical protein
VPWFGNARAWCCRVGIARPFRPHWTPTARKVAGGLDDPRFDFDLRLGPIDGRQRAVDRIEPGWKVSDDQRVGAVVDLHLAAGRQHRA